MYKEFYTVTERDLSEGWKVGLTSEKDCVNHVFLFSVFDNELVSWGLETLPIQG